MNGHKMCIYGSIWKIFSVNPSYLEHCGLMEHLDMGYTVCYIQLFTPKRYSSSSIFINRNNITIVKPIILPVQLTESQDGWMDDLRLYVLFNSTSVISV